MSALASKLGLSLLGAVRVFGSSVCPSPQDVEAELAKSASTGAGQIAVVRLDRNPANGMVRLLLYDANGEQRGVQSLPAETDCRVMAAAAATLVRGLDLSLDSVAPPPPMLVFRVPARTSNPASTALEVGAGGLGSLNAGGAGAAVVALVSMAIEDSPLRPQVAFEWEMPQHLAVGPGGQVTWWRLWVAPAVEWRLVNRSSFWVSLQGAVPLGAAFAAGSGYPLDQQGAAFDLGLSAGLRLGLAARMHPASRSSDKLLPWVGVWGIAWALPHTLTVAGESAGASLPRLEAAVGLGLSWSQR